VPSDGAKFGSALTRNDWHPETGILKLNDSKLKTTDIWLPRSACTAQRVPLEALPAMRSEPTVALDWRCLFTLPAWLTSWWEAFRPEAEPHVVLFSDRDNTIGLAPLVRWGTMATLIGSPDVCDYLDVVGSPERQHAFAEPFFEYLGTLKIRQLVLNGVHPDSLVWTRLVAHARSRRWTVTRETEDVTFAIDLPRTWEAFLYQLNGKQRHELRRKLRRLHEAGSVRFRMVDTVQEIKDTLNTFIRLFRVSRPDKAAFMTTRMAGFFRSLGTGFSAHHIIKLGFLDIDRKTVATVMCFDYRSTRYLYNSGYDPQFGSLSVGLLCKILSIKDAVDTGMTCYDLLKGAEVYKQRLSATPTDLYKCTVWLP
jgi:CelD/BcsL family acetyltransferase involved in cellulose biosynthesis